MKYLIPVTVLLAILVAACGSTDRTNFQQGAATGNSLTLQLRLPTQAREIRAQGAAEDNSVQVQVRGIEESGTFPLVGEVNAVLEPGQSQVDVRIDGLPDTVALALLLAQNGQQTLYTPSEQYELSAQSQIELELSNDDPSLDVLQIPQLDFSSPTLVGNEPVARGDLAQGCAVTVAPDGTLRSYSVSDCEVENEAVLTNDAAGQPSVTTD